ncbi:ribonuclease H-like domain-containing protein [Aetokthonos hydrillicola Thurmond2011]|jgi:uncharacterized protein YprB with RNaseH-like and TPR domain/predicted nuclease with RNAse H fold/dephospho-CoA kinase|uniref:Ribonuclease H-like domain-containing protein n=1 Tax=Aetokthonos hydrillicola Thurmond2011 TaxID=2712845 RepID=A0AAP5I6L0_9CYAN|nr:ribonuclease H-like domain-containing protein [Aetokthonos hydrillicola]MBO3461663.1 hypothetical protein [Aetokthonos hydrillicola CCALA 1050]MBW4588724.1 ribonuclease H-like domain-containing protein [Aetokthonos hydrillicola CCALA 1050]MDR9895942.1 ribonuclease H-like domain-containing protein [Aetokthonos hydrillicola Thurmond2011]
MLLSTFRHLKGIGAKTENELWRSGVVSWDHWETKKATQLSIFDLNADNSRQSLIQASRKAIENENADFFAESLPSSEYYRIALTFPRKTMFLDIETTGLSIYYNDITLVGWSMDSKYNVYIQGDDDYSFRRALTEAKIIVTFNGSLFDIPFICKKFHNLKLPKTHIDLRFLAKRVGLTGGQKKIEKLLGIKRHSKLLNIEGDSAPLLWSKYCRGDADSLRLLISYNHADIEGMKSIFDAVVARLIQKHDIPLDITASIHCFAAIPSVLQWKKSQSQSDQEGICIPDPKEKKCSNISLKDLADIQDLSNLKIVGIDLSGSENRASGWSLLEGDYVITKRLNTNSDIINATLDAKPTLVSIDSPLSLPKGRISVEDSDPGRQLYGITRSCERILKKRGINVYPSLIKSMQNLTARGIRLAQYFRKQGIPVIESYPGAAQDIMNIPRKQAGIEFLRIGLSEFGIRGDFSEKTISHDELDAITSAIVGIFFWNGKFEALGNIEEEYLIIPDVNSFQKTYNSRIVIGLSGSIAAGKTTAGKLLKSRGFHYFRYSLVLEDILNEQGIKPTREALQQIGTQVNQELGQRWLCKKLLEKLPKDGDIVIDGLRFPEDYAFWQETFGSSFLHIHIISRLESRMARYITRGGNSEEFVVANSQLTEQSIINLANLAHILIINDKTTEDFSLAIIQAVESRKRTN